MWQLWACSHGNCIFVQYFHCTGIQFQVIVQLIVLVNFGKKTINWTIYLSMAS